MQKEWRGCLVPRKKVCDDSIGFRPRRTQRQGWRLSCRGIPLSQSTLRRNWTLQSPQSGSFGGWVKSEGSVKSEGWAACSARSALSLRRWCFGPLLLAERVCTSAHVARLFYSRHPLRGETSAFDPKRTFLAVAGTTTSGSWPTAWRQAAYRLQRP